MSSDPFPILEHGIYANHAAIAPWPEAAAKALCEFAEENADTGPQRYKAWIARERQLRGQLADLIGAESEQDVAIVQNTSEGVCAVAFGYPWQPGDNVVLPAGEFPSNRLPWLAQAERGVEVREVEVGDNDDPEAALVGAMDERTRVLAVSSVSYSDGVKLDLGRLGAACASSGALFFVDAIQHLGALSFDARACQVDFLAAGAHKWLLGPEGIGLFYCHEAARARIGLTRVGWHMYDYPWNFSRSDWTPSRSARRFEAGSPNTSGQVVWHASLTLMLEIGIDEIARRVLANTRRLVDGLSALPGVRLGSPLVTRRQSGIVSFSTGGSGTREVFKRLLGAEVTCALRADRIRLSPHFYQDEAVMDRLLQHVEDAL